MRFLDVSRVRTRFHEEVVTADGTSLSVDLYMPPTPGSYPVLMHRTASDNNRSGRASVSCAPAERWKAFAAQGFIVATCDVRGRGDSDGRFTPFVHEASDGAATIQWLLQLGECNGKIGVLGSGYGAFCAWAAATESSSIGAIASISPFGAVGQGLVHRGGAVRLDWLFWMHLVAGRSVQPAHVPPWPRIHKHLPLIELDKALGREDIWWRDWLTHLAPDDPLWAPLDLAPAIMRMRIPGLHVTGWWDGLSGAAHYYYEAACRSETPQRLIVGPWDTAGVRRPTQHNGGFDFGPRSVIDLDEVMVDFFDANLRGGNRPADARCEMFVTGRNEWISCAGWPPAAGELNLHCTSSLGANTRRGDGVLSDAENDAGGVDEIVHDPAVPVEFQPQFVSFATGANPLGYSFDQMHITSRDEALVYTSKPLDKPVTACGRPKVAFSVRTLASDADLYVLLSDTFPLGLRDLHLTHAAIRLATLDSFRVGELIRVELELDPIAHDFQPGHCIRLTLTPSLFPLYARNPHATDYVSSKECALAAIEVRHGSQWPTLLSLPVLDNEQVA